LEGSVKKKILVIGATNFPEKIDPAILRSGRMDKRIFISPPDANARCELFRLFLEEKPISEDIDYEKLARVSDGLISSDLKTIVNNAALKALRERALISMNLIELEVLSFMPSLKQDDINCYLAFESYHRG
jgi:transitional endoplasmic reticulum ATPase